MNPETPRTPREEMETWLTALLLGELSGGEAAAVRELIKHDPELAKLHDQLKQAISMVREAMLSEAETHTTSPEPLQLSEERRKKLQAAFLIPPLKETDLKPKPRVRFRLIELLVVLSIVAILAAMLLPALSKAKSKSQRVAVMSNLRQLDAAKQQWAMENGKSSSDAPTFDDLKPYFKGEMPSVGGEKYVLGKVGEPPSAEIAASDAKKSFGRLSGPALSAAPSDRVRLSADGGVSMVGQGASKPAKPQAEDDKLGFRTWGLSTPEATSPSAVPAPEARYYRMAKGGQMPAAPAAQPPPPVQIVLPSSPGADSHYQAGQDYGLTAWAAGEANSRGAVTLSGQPLGEPKWVGSLEKPVVTSSAGDAFAGRYAYTASPTPAPGFATSDNPQSAPLIDPSTGLPVTADVAGVATATPELATVGLPTRNLRQSEESQEEAFRRRYVAAADPLAIPRVSFANATAGGGGGGGGGKTEQPNPRGQSKSVGESFSDVSDIAGTSSKPEEGKTVITYDDLNRNPAAGTPLDGVDKAEVARALSVTPPKVDIHARFTEIRTNDNRALGFDWYLGDQEAKGASGLAGQSGVLYTNSAGRRIRAGTPVPDGGRLAPESNVYSVDVVGYANVPPQKVAQMAVDESVARRPSRTARRLAQNRVPLEREATKNLTEVAAVGGAAATSGNQRELESLRQKTPEPLMGHESLKGYEDTIPEREKLYAARRVELEELKSLDKEQLRRKLSELSDDSELQETSLGLKVAEERLAVLQKNSTTPAADVQQARKQVEDLKKKADGRAGGVMARLETQTAMLGSELESLKESVAVGKAIEGRADPAKLRELADLSLRKPATNAPIPQPEILTSENNFSTFSLNVSDVSFKLAAASLEKGQMPDPASVRSEEFINAFDYRDPEPLPGAPIAFAWERARYPFAVNRDLLRFSLKTAAAGRQAGRPLNIVLLLDNSGSMERADRVRIIHEALRVLASQLQPQDKLSVITFARTPRLIADGIAGDKAGEVTEQVSGLTPQGGTNLEEAMNLAYQTAARHYLIDGINRVVLLTDGAANLGDVEPASLKQKVEAARKQGIALDCFGIGWEGFNDDLLEVLSRNGDGRYGFINSPEEAATDFVGQLAGALKVAASDVKVQVEFNPARVTSYRQIGYAKHQLTKEQFRDNTVDAAEIAAQEAGNALYTVEVNPAGSGPLGTVRVRYKIPGTTNYREQAWDVPYAGNALALDQSSPAMRLAAGASAFAEWLVASPFAGEVSPDAVLGYLRGVPEVFGADSRPKKLEWMIRQAKSIEGK
jgi:Mg-chelatase subunit ChlD/type II secretory pathway pseudopilin PulG